jgi:hypothetical protein
MHLTTAPGTQLAVPGCVQRGLHHLHASLQMQISAQNMSWLVGWVITHPFALVEKGRGRKEWARKHGVCEAASFQALDTILLAGLDNPAWTLLQAAHRQGTHTVHTHCPMQDFSSVKLHKLLTPRNMVI